MKIVVHLNHGVDKSYLLVFGKNSITRDQVRQIINQNDDISAKQLIFKSGERYELNPSEARRAEMVADFVVSQHGYSAERLA